MNTLTSNPVKRSAPSPTGQTPEAKRTAEKPTDSTNSTMGDNNDPRSNIDPLKGNKPPQDTGKTTSISPKSTGTRRPGADNSRGRRSPTHSPTRSGRGRDKRQAGKTHEVNTNSASRPSRYDEYTKSGNRGQSSTPSRSRHAKWLTVSLRKGTNYSAKHRSRDIEADNSTRVPPNEGMPGHEADEYCKCFNCHAKKIPQGQREDPALPTSWGEVLRSHEAARGTNPRVVLFPAAGQTSLATPNIQVAHPGHPGESVWQHRPANDLALTNRAGWVNKTLHIETGHQHPLCRRGKTHPNGSNHGRPAQNIDDGRNY